MTTTTMTPEGGATDVLDAAARGITAPHVPRPPVFILASDYLARERAREAALQLAGVTPEVRAP